MFLGRVVGEMVSTLKHPALQGTKLLWVEKVDPSGRPLGARTLAVDTVDAGEGDPVLVLDEGNGAAQVLKRGRGPIRTVIVGVIDEVTHP
ncbi:MAG: EutN/CcmL family microcompartment protein [Candidatus Eisenbacteria bacterium]